MVSESTMVTSFTIKLTIVFYLQELSYLHRLIENSRWLFLEHFHLSSYHLGLSFLTGFRYTFQ